MNVPPLSPADDDEMRVLEMVRTGRQRIRAELAKTIVGQAEAVEQLLISLFAGGHCLITGAPGLAKTLLVKSIAQVFHLKFQRIQFTPDLMPADITGTEILEQDENGRRQVVFVKGFFRDTLPSLDAGPFSLIRLDGDMYESTIIALDSLYPKLTPGGYVIIDDYGAILQCKNAVTDFRTKHGIDAEITMVDWTGAWWRKPLV